MLETEDIQHILLTRTPALTGRYEFLSFGNAAGGRAWLSAVSDKVKSAAEVLTSVDTDKRWVTVALTWNGLRALGVDEASLATSPKSSSKAWLPARRCLAIPERITLATGWVALPAQIFTPSLSCSPATSLSAAAARASTTSSSNSAKAWRCSQH